MAEEMNWSVAQHATGGPSSSSATSQGLHELMLRAPQEGYQSTSQAMLDESEQTQAPAETTSLVQQQYGSGSREDRLQQLRQWEESIRTALSANNEYQTAALGLWRDMDAASARLQDLEQLSRDIVDEMQMPKDAVIVPEGQGELHQINLPWFKHFHGVELPSHRDAEIFRRYQVNVRQFIWSKDEIRALKSEVSMELGKLRAIEAAKNRVPVRQLEEWTIQEESDRIDWEKVSGHKHLLEHGPEGCRMRWTNFEHPSLAKNSWSKDESVRLKQLVTQYGERDWASIANEMGTNRTPAACLKQYRRDKGERKDWTEQEDKALKEGIILHGTDWQTIARYVGRNSDQCVTRWTKSLRPGIRRGKWTDAEDKQLKAAVEHFSAEQVGGAPLSWKKVASRIDGRTDQQCRERYVNQLDPNLKPPTSWTAEEDATLRQLVAEKGPVWIEISKAMGENRTDSKLRKRWEELVKREQRAAKTPPKPSSSKPKNPNTHLNKKQAQSTDGGNTEKTKKKGSAAPGQATAAGKKSAAASQDLSKANAAPAAAEGSAGATESDAALPKPKRRKPTPKARASRQGNTSGQKPGSHNAIPTTTRSGRESKRVQL